MISPRGISFTGMSDADNVVSNCEVMRETEKQFSPGETAGRGRDHMTVSSPGHWPLLYSYQTRPEASWATHLGQGI